MTKHALSLTAVVWLATGAAAFAGPFSLFDGGKCEQENCEDCEHGQYEPPRRWTQEWYEARAHRPIGARQRYHNGKHWPPYPRPIGPEAELCHRFHAAHYWPWPYNCKDRAYVRDVFALQANNGWMQETTLYDYHFTDEHQLNRAGEAHLRWILHSTPPQRRLAFVQTTTSQELSEARLLNVRTAATQMVGDEHLPPIMLRVTDPLGSPAVDVDAIQRAIRDTIPEPRIEYTPVSSAGSSGGS